MENISFLQAALVSRHNT